MDDHHQDDSRSYWIQKEGGRISCLMNNSHAHVFGGDSWEEQAFAEDAAVGGGCVWPPRSYTCSFCRREFRSAQALGGHMNVHRRDRAKLKQINISGNSTSSNSNNKNQIFLENSAAAANYTTSSSFDDRCSTHHHHQQHHVSLLQSNNPNNTSFDLDPHHNIALLSSTSSPIRPYNSSTASILHPFTCNSFGQQQQHKSCTPPILMSWPTKFEPRKRFHIEDLGNQDADCITKVIESNSTNSKKNINNNHEIHFTAGNLSSSALVRKRSSFQHHDEEEADDGLMFMKKRRVLIDDDGGCGGGGQHYLFPKNSNLQVINDEEEVLIEPPAVEVHHERSPNSTLESLDLELRLGDKP